MNGRDEILATLPVTRAIVEMTEPRPAMTAYRDGVVVGVLLSPHLTDENCVAMYGLLASAALALDADGVLMIDPIYALQTAEDEELLVRPRDDPRSVEALRAFYATADRTTWAIQRYRRDDDGSLRWEDVAWPPSGTSGMEVLLREVLWSGQASELRRALLEQWGDPRQYLACLLAVGFDVVTY